MKTLAKLHIFFSQAKVLKFDFSSQSNKVLSKSLLDEFRVYICILYVHRKSSSGQPFLFHLPGALCFFRIFLGYFSLRSLMKFSTLLLIFHSFTSFSLTFLSFLSNSPHYVPQISSLSLLILYPSYPPPHFLLYPPLSYLLSPLLTSLHLCFFYTLAFSWSNLLWFAKKANLSSPHKESIQIPFRWLDILVNKKTPQIPCL